MTTPEPVAPADPSAVEEFTQRIRLVYRQWGITIPEGRGGIEALDAARNALPPPPAVDGWRPHATLIGFGLLRTARNQSE